MSKWEIGDRYGVAGLKPSMFGEGRCSYCDKVGAELIWEGRRNINGEVMDAHVHRFPEPWYGDGPDEWQVMAYEPGNPRLVATVYSQEDAERIVASAGVGSDVGGSGDGPNRKAGSSAPSGAVVTSSPEPPVETTGSE